MFRQCALQRRALAPPAAESGLPAVCVLDWCALRLFRYGMRRVLALRCRSACHGTYISRTYSSGRGPAGERRVQRALCRCRGRGAAGSGWCVHRADASLLPHLHLCLHLPFFRVPRVRAHRGPLWRPPAGLSRRDRPCCARPPRLVAKQFQDAGSLPSWLCPDR